MPLHPSIILTLTGLLAGFIDSIAGGGGLITVPALSLFLGLGPLTIGTNKIAGTLSALVALMIYSSKGHMDWRRGWVFTLFIGAGSFLGSSLNPLLPVSIFPIFLAITCPLLLWILWKKDLWISKEAAHTSSSSNPKALVVLGLLCGFYDGLWGPGGGTFMFLSLFFVSRLPLLTSLAISKLANFTSAGVSLYNFARLGHVRWELGIYLSAGIVVGALAGSILATRRAAQIVRPILLIVVFILMIRIFYD